jgi:hypothetical protein
MVTGAPTRQYTDAQLDYYLQVATANVEQWTERIFEQQTYTEVYRGDGYNTHLVYEYPIISVTSIKQDTISDVSVETIMDPTKLVLDDRNLSVGRIELDGFDEVTTFSPSSLYTLVYEGGFATLPIAVKHATVLWAAELLRPDYAGVRSDAPEIVPLTTEQITELLGPLRRRRV